MTEPEVYRETIRTARRDHYCCECIEGINAGEKYHYCSGRTKENGFGSGVLIGAAIDSGLGHSCGFAHEDMAAKIEAELWRDLLLRDLFYRRIIDATWAGKVDIRKIWMP